MIGQKKLLQKIDNLIQHNFPRFLLLVGTKGCGKHLMAKEIAERLSVTLVPIGNGVEEVRQTIKNAYTNTEPIMYLFADTENMSVAAKNALLKVTEEPPQQAYFVMTVSSTQDTLSTITSRACVLNMDSYSLEELREYTLSKSDKLSEDEIMFVTTVALTPSDVSTILSYDIKEYKNFVQSVCDNLHVVNSANSLKIGNKLALKKDEDKWDVILTLNALKWQYYNKYMATKQKFYYKAHIAVCNAIYDIMIKNSVNKQYCVDELILNIRKIWRENA